MLKILLLSIGLIGIAFLGFAISMIFKRNGKFPEIHIGKNKEMKKRGIVCAKTQDKIERKKLKEELKYKDLKPLT